MTTFLFICWMVPLHYLLLYSHCIGISIKVSFFLRLLKFVSQHVDSSFYCCGYYWSNLVWLYCCQKLDLHDDIKQCQNQTLWCRPIVLKLGKVLKLSNLGKCWSKTSEYLNFKLKSYSFSKFQRFQICIFQTKART